MLKSNPIYTLLYANWGIVFFFFFLLKTRSAPVNINKNAYIKSYFSNIFQKRFTNNIILNYATTE